MENKCMIRKYAAKLAFVALLLLPVACTKDPPEDPVVSVTGVTLNLPSTSLSIGKTLTLEATIEPEDADNKTVTWSTGNEQVATVNSAGEVTAVAPGTAVITATTNDGKFTASCTVTVAAPGVITMTTQKPEVEIWVDLPLSVGSDNFTIDWGDGKKNNLNDAYFISEHTYEQVVSLCFSYNYSEAFEHRITITGDNIVRLDCSQNQLTALDVSRYPYLKHLNCWLNQLVSLDVSKNIALENLNVRDNSLTSLDVSKNTALEVLIIGGTALTSLDVSHNTELRLLNCKDAQITNLDVSKNTALTSLNCRNNELISLDVSNNNELLILACGGNQLTAAALNDLFETLPFVPELILSENTSGQPTWVYFTGWLDISDNPGIFECEFSIAVEKNWGSWPDKYPKSMKDPTSELDMIF